MRRGRPGSGLAECGEDTQRARCVSKARGGRDPGAWQVSSVTVHDRAARSPDHDLRSRAVAALLPPGLVLVGCSVKIPSDRPIVWPCCPPLQVVDRASGFPGISLAAAMARREFVARRDNRTNLTGPAPPPADKTIPNPPTNHRPVVSPLTTPQPRALSSLAPANFPLRPGTASALPIFPLLRPLGPAFAGNTSCCACVRDPWERSVAKGPSAVRGPDSRTRVFREPTPPVDARATVQISCISRIATGSLPLRDEVMASPSVQLSAVSSFGCLFQWGCSKFY